MYSTNHMLLLYNFTMYSTKNIKFKQYWLITSLKHANFTMYSTNHMLLLYNFTMYSTKNIKFKRYWLITSFIARGMNNQSFTKESKYLF